MKYTSLFSVGEIGIGNEILSGSRVNAEAIQGCPDISTFVCIGKESM
jgi:hypothetical protein